MPVCTCPGFEFYGSCKHTKQVMEDIERMAEEGSTALVPIRVQPPATLMPTRDELSVMKAIAQEAVKATGMVPASLKTPEQAFAVMLAGRELGAQPMTSLRHIFVVNGKTEPDAQLMMGAVMANDPTAQFIWHERTAQSADLELRRAGRAPTRLKYTIDDAKKAGLAGKQGPWQQYPADMLAWFTAKRVCRSGAADLINALDGIRVSNADSVMLDAPEIIVEGPANLSDPSLYSEGDDPDTTPAAAIEAEAIASEPIAADETISPPGSPREDFDKWCAERKWTPEAVRQCLDIAKEVDDPVAHWINTGVESGLTIEEALAEARSALASMSTEIKKLRDSGVTQGLNKQALEVVNPLGRLIEAANRKREATPTVEEEAPGAEEAPVGPA